MRHARPIRADHPVSPVVLSAMLMGCALGQSSTTQPASAPGPPRIAAFQSGICINWPERQVEVDSTVNLRTGAIELFACSPGAREHEAIVRIEARPTHLFQALGLLGLAPGNPIRYNEVTGQIEAATGDPVEIDIRYKLDGQTRVVPIEAWMLDVRQRQPIPRLSWIFTGSVSDGKGGVAADYEGTVIALVDFGSSLIGLPERHSDSNEQLWLVPNTAAIPPLDTPCKLLFRLGPTRLRLEPDGTIWVLGRWVSPDDLPGLITRIRQDRPAGRFHISTHAACSPDRIRSLARRLKQLGVPEDHIQFAPAATTKPIHERTPDKLDTSSSPSDVPGSPTVMPHKNSQ